jgi:hypothetical protein
MRIHIRKWPQMTIFLKPYYMGFLLEFSFWSFYIFISLKHSHWMWCPPLFLLLEYIISYANIINFIIVSFSPNPWRLCIYCVWLEWRGSDRRWWVDKNKSNLVREGERERNQFGYAWSYTVSKEKQTRRGKRGGIQNLLKNDWYLGNHESLSSNSVHFNNHGSSG